MDKNKEMGMECEACGGGKRLMGRGDGQRGRRGMRRK